MRLDSPQYGALLLAALTARLGSAAPREAPELRPQPAAAAGPGPQSSSSSHTSSSSSSSCSYSRVEQDPGLRYALPGTLQRHEAQLWDQRLLEVHHQLVTHGLPLALLISHVAQAFLVETPEQRRQALQEDAECSTSAAAESAGEHHPGESWTSSRSSSPVGTAEYAAAVHVMAPLAERLVGHLTLLRRKQGELEQCREPTPSSGFTRLSGSFGISWGGVAHPRALYSGPARQNLVMQQEVATKLRNMTNMLLRHKLPG